MKRHPVVKAAFALCFSHERSKSCISALPVFQTIDSVMDSVTQDDDDPTQAKYIGDSLTSRTGGKPTERWVNKPSMIDSGKHILPLLREVEIRSGKRCRPILMILRS